ncbi:peroxide stress protein YaaA [Stakelama saccharophila]|uniref:UPF0246 protein RPR59_07385 n=1 Tax=Stakelama saccharophila TaxID=3075605 RepID=A0ABZ0BDQ9_9SPHN|nr:peroxide stress protein YaaA [Stakelama sp. W311]WNO55058.1 peroxide stress protein YaaA [Stakelama sp. W311]
MIVTLSPAKTLDYSSALPDIAPTRPRFREDADKLAAAAARLGAKKLGGLMKISDKLAKLNAERFREFADAPERPALFAFAGDVYTGLEVATLDAPAIDFAQDHVRILSGLYGLLRPHDEIRPYRLEMGTRWAPGRVKDIYHYWDDRIANALADDVRAEGSDTVLNLASNEYWHAVKGRLPAGIRVVDVDFREPGPDGPRIVSFHAKKARGMMARWLCEHRVRDVEAMKQFDSAGYRYDAGTSTDDHWQFLRA